MTVKPDMCLILAADRRNLNALRAIKVHSVTGRHWHTDSGLTAINLFSSGELWGDEAYEKVGNYLPALTYQAPYLGDPGLDLSGNPLPIDGAGNSLLTDTVMPDYNTMCLECHQYALGSLIAIDYSKKHGSDTAEPADGIVGFMLADPFDNATRGEFFLDCLDCHEPHGSQNMMLHQEIC